MKNKIENKDVNYVSLEDFVDYSKTISDIDRKFIQRYINDNNLDSEDGVIDITTNEIELSFFIQHIINAYYSYLYRKRYITTKS